MAKEITETPKKKSNFFAKFKFKTSGGSKDKAALWGKIGFTLGIVSAGAWLVPILGLAVTICGLVFNILGLRADKGRWFAVTGLTLSIVFLNLTFVYGFYNVLLSLFRASGI